jgi:hypothetical protein
MAQRKPAGAGEPKLPPLWDRLQAQIDWYDRKAKSNQTAYKISKISIVALAILLPVFAEYGHVPGFEGSPAFLVGAAAGAIVLLEGLQVLNKWQENWILYRATCENLRNEQHLFAETAGPYAGLNPDAAQRQLAERISRLVMAEHSKWSQAHEHKIETTGAF